MKERRLVRRVARRLSSEGMMLGAKRTLRLRSYEEQDCSTKLTET